MTYRDSIVLWTLTVIVWEKSVLHNFPLFPHWMKPYGLANVARCTVDRDFLQESSSDRWSIRATIRRPIAEQSVFFATRIFLRLRFSLSLWIRSLAQSGWVCVASLPTRLFTGCTSTLDPACVTKLRRRKNREEIGTAFGGNSGGERMMEQQSGRPTTRRWGTVRTLRVNSYLYCDGCTMHHALYSPSFAARSETTSSGGDGHVQSLRVNAGPVSAHHLLYERCLGETYHRMTHLCP